MLSGSFNSGKLMQTSMRISKVSNISKQNNKSGKDLDSSFTQSMSQEDALSFSPFD